MYLVAPEYTCPQSWDLDFSLVCSKISRVLYVTNFLSYVLDSGGPKVNSWHVVYSIYYMDTLVLPLYGRGEGCLQEMIVVGEQETLSYWHMDHRYIYKVHNVTVTTIHHDKATDHGHLCDMWCHIWWQRHVSNQATDIYISHNSGELVPVPVIGYRRYTDHFNTSEALITYAQRASSLWSSSIKSCCQWASSLASQEVWPAQITLCCILSDICGLLVVYHQL